MWAGIVYTMNSTDNDTSINNDWICNSSLNNLKLHVQLAIETINYRHIIYSIMHNKVISIVLSLVAKAIVNITSHHKIIS